MRGSARGADRAARSGARPGGRARAAGRRAARGLPFRRHRLAAGRRLRRGPDRRRGARLHARQQRLGPGRRPGRPRLCRRPGARAAGGGVGRGGDPGDASTTWRPPRASPSPTFRCCPPCCCRGSPGARSRWCFRATAATSFSSATNGRCHSCATAPLSPGRAPVRRFLYAAGKLGLARRRERHHPFPQPGRLLPGGQPPLPGGGAAAGGARPAGAAGGFRRLPRRGDRRLAQPAALRPPRRDRRPAAARPQEDGHGVDVFRARGALAAARPRGGGAGRGRSTRSPTSKAPGGDFERKTLLRGLLARKVPAALLPRKKLGFSVPLAELLRTHLAASGWRPRFSTRRCCRRAFSTATRSRPCGRRIRKARPTPNGRCGRSWRLQLYLRRTAGRGGGGGVSAPRVAEMPRVTWRQAAGLVAVSLLFGFLLLELGARTYSWHLGKGFWSRPHSFDSPFFVTYDPPMPLFRRHGGRVPARRAVADPEAGGRAAGDLPGRLDHGQRGGQGPRRTTPRWPRPRCGMQLPGRPLRVLEGGGDAFATSHSVVNFALRLSALEPDVVTLLHNINDLTAQHFGDRLTPDYANKYLDDAFLAYEHRGGFGRRRPAQLAGAPDAQVAGVAAQAGLRVQLAAGKGGQSGGRPGGLPAQPGQLRSARPGARRRAGPDHPGAPRRRGRGVRRRVPGLQRAGARGGDGDRDLAGRRGARALGPAGVFRRRGAHERRRPGRAGRAGGAGARTASRSRPAGRRERRRPAAAAVGDRADPRAAGAAREGLGVAGRAELRRFRAADRRRRLAGRQRRKRSPSWRPATGGCAACCSSKTAARAPPATRRCANAAASWSALLDDDDLAAPERFARQVALLDSGPRSAWWCRRWAGWTARARSTRCGRASSAAASCRRIRGRFSGSCCFEGNYLPTDGADGPARGDSKVSVSSKGCGQGRTGSSSSRRRRGARWWRPCPSRWCWCCASRATPR